MKAVTTLNEEQLRTLITKITTIIKKCSNVFLDITRGDLSLTSTSFDGISWYHTLKYNKASYVIRFNELSKIRISNGEFENGNLLLLEHGCMCYYFCKDSNIFHMMFTDDNKQRFEHTFNHNFGSGELDLFAVSTVMPLPDDIEMHLNLFNTVDDGFICIDDIPVLESHYDSIITLLDAAINGERK